MRAMKRVKRKDLQGQELSAKTLDLLEAWLGIRIKDATHLVQYVESSEFQTIGRNLCSQYQSIGGNQHQRAAGCRVDREDPGGDPGRIKKRRTLS